MVPMKEVKPSKRRGDRAAIPVIVFCLVACAGLTSHLGPPPATAPDPYFNSLFTRTDGWTGGDGTLSVPLGDGRTLWLFGDSFLGKVNPDGTRPEDAPLVRNCIVVQDGDALSPRTGGNREMPAAFFPPLPPGEWCWPADATVQNQKVLVMLHSFRQGRPQLWDWQWIGTAVAELGLPELDIERITPLAVSNGVMYATILERADATYIFGVQARGSARWMHVARAPPGDFLGPWEFFDGEGWSADPAVTRPVLEGVSTQFGVAALSGGLALVTMDNRVPFGADLVMYRSAAPQGPWHGPCRLYRAPEAGAAIVAYNPFLHPQFTSGGRLLVSYNLNHIKDPTALYRDAAIYRPRFVRVHPAACPPEKPQLPRVHP
jgi:hypothetical protein